MTSKLGVYWSVMHRRAQDYEYFKQLQPSVFKIMDGGPPDYQFARDNLPNSLVIARDHALSEQHSDMLKDPVATGKRHAQEWDKHQARLGFDRAKTLILGINEPHVWEPGVPEALRLYTIAMCEEATKLRLRVGAMQLSVGWPNNNGPDTPPNWEPWHGVDNAIRHNNGALICHEYWADSGPAENWGWWAGRVLKCPWQVPIVIGECGVDIYVKDGSVNHAQRGWLGRMEPDAYARELADYVGRMSADSRYVGCAVFASDFASHEWYSSDIETAYQAILATPIPDVKPPTQPPTQPPDPIPGTVQSGMVTAPAGLNLRELPSADATKLGALAYGSTVLYDDAQAGWLHVVDGWVSGEWVGPVGMVEPEQAESAPSEGPQPQPMPTGILDPRVLQAILAIESGGRTHGENGKPIIRLEAHIFKTKLGNDGLWAQHFRTDPNKPWLLQEWRSHVDKPWTKLHTGSQADEYAALSLALSLAQEAAYQSISMGAGQIMGFNHARIGYPSATAMFKAFQSAPVQTIGFINFFLSDAKLVEAMRNKDWRRIAALYNGSGAIDTYAPLLQKAYEELA